MDTEKTEEEIQAQLAGLASKGPLEYAGKPLAALSRGLRDVWIKTLRESDTARFADIALLYILRAAYAETQPEKLAKRSALIRASDSSDTFRAEISLWMDELSEDELSASRAITNEILSIIEKADVVIAEKKSEQAG